MPIAVRGLAAAVIVLVLTAGDVARASQSPNELTLRMIVVTSAETAERVLARLAAGEAFGAVAQAMSVDASAIRGGWMGSLKVADLRPEMRAALSGITPGQITRVVPLPSGFSILKVEPPGSAPGLDDVRASVLDGRASPTETIATLQQILAADPKSAEAHVLLGILYGRDGSLALAGESIAELRQALAIAPGDITARFYLGRAYLDAGQIRRAHEELQEAVARAPNRPDLLTWLGEAERLRGNPKRAVELGRQARQIDPSLTQASYHLGHAYLDLDRPDEAVAELEQAVRAGSESSDALEFLGTAYLDARRPADALPVLLRAAAIPPPSPAPHVKLARAYRMDGQLAKAEEQLALVERMSDIFRAQVTRGDQAPPSVAATDFVRQVEVDTLVERGLLLNTRGDTDRALKLLTQALQLSGDDGRIHRHIAETALEAGLLPLAREHADAAAKLGRPLSEAARARLGGAPGGGK
jgi:tetratricopeptide (TPR) repeat protein